MIKEIVEREKDRKKEVGKKGKNEHVFKVNCFRPQHIFLALSNQQNTVLEPLVH